jgi:hypothetical protein
MIDLPAFRRVKEIILDIIEICEKKIIIENLKFKNVDIMDQIYNFIEEFLKEFGVSTLVIRHFTLQETEKIFIMIR